MATNRMPSGTVHKLPKDLRTALVAHPNGTEAWRDITPLARNEFICWLEDAKQAATRERRIRRAVEELNDGQGRDPSKRIAMGRRWVGATLPLLVGNRR